MRMHFVEVTEPGEEMRPPLSVNPLWSEVARKYASSHFDLRCHR
jgi:hypothetical protein